MKLFSERMIIISKFLFDLKGQVLQSWTTTSALHNVGNELQIRVLNRKIDRKIVGILKRKNDRLEVKLFNTNK